MILHRYKVLCNQIEIDCLVDRCGRDYVLDAYDSFGLGHGRLAAFKEYINRIERSCSFGAGDSRRQCLEMVKWPGDSEDVMRETRTLILVWLAACGLITLAIVPIRLYGLSANDWLVGALATLGLAFFVAYFVVGWLWRPRTVKAAAS